MVEIEKQKGVLEYSPINIRFFKESTGDSIAKANVSQPALKELHSRV